MASSEAARKRNRPESQQPVGNILDLRAMRNRWTSQKGRTWRTILCRSGAARHARHVRPAPATHRRRPARRHRPGRLRPPRPAPGGPVRRLWPAAGWQNRPRAAGPPGHGAGTAGRAGEKTVIGPAWPAWSSEAMTSADVRRSRRSEHRSGLDGRQGTGRVGSAIRRGSPASAASAWGGLGGGMAGGDHHDVAAMAAPPSVDTIYWPCS